MGCPVAWWNRCPDEARKLTEVSRQIDYEIQTERKKQSAVIRLLLLGASDSGKSTLLKQMRILHMNGFSKEELSLRKHTIQTIVVTNMVKLCMYLSEYGLHLDTQQLKRDRDLLLDIVDNGAIVDAADAETKWAIKRLWENKSIQTCYLKRDDFHLSDSARYFFDNVDRILSFGYVPNNDDILHARVQTVGVEQISFTIRLNEFRVTDVGGQRTQRRKWIHFFDNVDAVIFLIAVNEFDQLLAEDEKTNRLHEAMQLYKSILNSHWFKRSSIILFLNKKDLLQQKLADGKSLSCCFKDYKGNNSYEDSILFLRDHIQTLKKPTLVKQVYVHETCATDTEQIQKVISSVTETLLDKRLRIKSKVRITVPKNVRELSINVLMMSCVRYRQYHEEGITFNETYPTM